MFLKKINFILIIFLIYQNPVYSKSNSFVDINSKNVSKYFSGIIAFENEDNSKALNFFSTSKILINRHDVFLKRYFYSLILENKVSQAINLIKEYKDNDKINFFDAYLTLIIDNLKKNNLEKAYFEIKKITNSTKLESFEKAILKSLEQYIYVFREKKLLGDKKNLGKLSIISETFQRCYLKDQNIDIYFSKLFNESEANFSRYKFFYLSNLIESGRIKDAKKISKDINYLNTTLLLSQAKDWISSEKFEKLVNVFSCQNHNDIISEFLFLISNLYSSENEIRKSNFYLILSNFLNPKFKFNLSLVAENLYFNEEYKKTKEILKNFKKEDSYYYWYRIKKEAQIILKTRNKKESINYITAEFNKIDNPSNKVLFDIANFYKNLKEYDEAIKFYTKIINSINNHSDIKSDLLYRRGASYERIGDYEKSDTDLLNSLVINPGDPYVLNYLAYSWLERDYKLDKAIGMLETAYESKKNDPYIIDSIGWAYYLVEDYFKAEKFLKRAVELMPDDPIVNDHYGDILWKLDRKIQARYFWTNVLSMEEAESEMIKNINIKILEGLKSS